MPATATRPLGMFALLRAAGAVHDFVESRLATVGLSIPRLAALERLVDAGGSLPLGQLADRLACVKSNVTQLVDRLEADGLVARVLDPGDKRSRLAVVTDAGRLAREAGTRVQSEVETQLFTSLTFDETARLAEIIQKIRNATGDGGSHSGGCP